MSFNSFQSMQIHYLNDRNIAGIAAMIQMK